VRLEHFNEESVFYQTIVIQKLFKSDSTLNQILASKRPLGSAALPKQRKPSGAILAHVIRPTAWKKLALGYCSKTFGLYSFFKKLRHFNLSWVASAHKLEYQSAMLIFTPHPFSCPCC